MTQKCEAKVQYESKNTIIQMLYLAIFNQNTLIANYSTLELSNLPKWRILETAQAIWTANTNSLQNVNVDYSFVQYIY